MPKNNRLSLLSSLLIIALAGHQFIVPARGGFAHLYAISTDGGEPVRLTAGKFEVSDVRLSRVNSEIKRKRQTPKIIGSLSCQSE